MIMTASGTTHTSHDDNHHFVHHDALLPPEKREGEREG